MFTSPLELDQGADTMLRWQVFAAPNWSTHFATSEQLRGKREPEKRQASPQPAMNLVTHNDMLKAINAKAPVQETRPMGWNDFNVEGRCMADERCAGTRGTNARPVVSRRLAAASSRAASARICM